MQIKKKILIVDEDTNYISGLRKELQQAGLEMIHCDDSQKAIDIMENMKPDLIISEVNLSPVDGHSFFNEVKSKFANKDVPFIFISSQKRVDDRIKSMEIGVDDFISKPFYNEEIVARIQNILQEITTFGEYLSKNGKGFSGRLAEMNLIDLMQTLEVGKKSATINLTYHNYEGVVSIQNGNIVDANLKNLPPKDALLKMFLWTEGTYRVEMSKADYPRTINQTNDELIHEGRNRTIRWEKIKQNLPPLHTIIALNDIAFDVNNISDGEKKLLSSINGNTMIYDIIIKSPYDDIQTLEIVDNLYRKGYIKETNDNYLLQPENDISRIKRELSRDSAGRKNVSYIISNLLKRSTAEQEIKIDRRRDERRQLPERRQFERRKDRRVWENKVFLDKTELLMIREKLI